MSQLLGPADPSRRDRQVTVQRNDACVAVKGLPFPPTLTTDFATLQNPVLQCLRVTKWYGNVIGVNQVTLELRPGITGLVGTNGAGKSTLMRLITGHLSPDIGQVLLFDPKHPQSPVHAWSSQARQLVGYCPDVDAFYEEMSGREFVEAMARLSGFTAADTRIHTERVLQRVGMADRANRRIRGYSKGMRQRIKLAQALLLDPPLLVLDEPMSGIDPVGRAEFVTLVQSLAAQGKCLLISSHELDELEKLTDHVAIMAHGRIAAVDTVERIRGRLTDQPMRVRIDLIRQSRTPEEGKDRDHRDLAALLLSQLPEVMGIEVIDETDQPGVGRLVVKTKATTHFFAELNRIVLDEWYEISHIETLDRSTQAVLKYLLSR